MESSSKDSNSLIYGDELDIKILISGIWSSKVLIISTTLLATILTVMLTLLMSNIYQSSVVLEPTEDESNQTSIPFASMISSFSQGGERSVSKTKQALEILDSKDFFESLYVNEDFILGLMAFESYKKSSDIYIYNNKIYDSSKEIWLKGKPSLLESYMVFHSDFFSKAVNFRESPFITLNIKHRSPHVAKQWLDLILNNLDQYLKERDAKISEESIKFLEDRLKNSTQTSKPYLAQLIMIETQKLTRTKVNNNYAFTIIDSPRVPELKISPNRTVLCLTVAGIVFGFCFLIVFVLATFQKKLEVSPLKLRFRIIDLINK